MYISSQVIHEGKFADFARETILGVPKAVKRVAVKKRPTGYDRPLQYKLMGLKKDITGKFNVFPDYRAEMA